MQKIIRMLGLRRHGLGLQDLVRSTNSSGARQSLFCSLARAQTELRTKMQYAARLEVLLRSRTERIDELVAEVDQLRHQNKQLTPRPNGMRRW